jgi:hypothetical protein
LQQDSATIRARFAASNRRFTLRIELEFSSHEGNVAANFLRSHAIKKIIELRFAQRSCGFASAFARGSCAVISAESHAIFASGDHRT